MPCLLELHIVCITLIMLMVLVVIQASLYEEYDKQIDTLLICHILSLLNDIIIPTVIRGSDAGLLAKLFEYYSYC